VKHFICSVTFSENRAVYAIWESAAGHRRQYNTAHALFILDNKGHTHIHSEYVIHKFFHGNNGCANATECNVRTLPILITERPSLPENFTE